MQTLLQDVRYAMRTMRQNAGFTTAAILALALGIGATTAIFSVVNGVILRPLPYPDSDRRAQVFETEPQLPTVPVNMSDYLDWKKQVRSFESLAMYLDTVSNLTGTGEPDRVRTMLAESTLLPLLGAAPVIGRNFLADKNQPGHQYEAILTYGFWTSRFGGDRAIIGRKLLLDNESYSIVGVLPAGFQFLTSNIDVWLPLSLDLTKGNNKRGNHGLWVLGRLARGVTVDQVHAEMKSLAAGIEKQYPHENAGVSAAVFILRERMLAQIRPALLVLLGAVGCVLLIACANVANLLLARAAVRQKEMAVRIALGAGRGRIMRQLLTESVLLSFSAAAIGLMLAWWSIDIVRGVKSSRIPRINEVTVDSNVLLFAIAIAIGTALLFGLAPALRMSAADLAGAVKQASGRTTETPAQRRVRMLLVAGEVCLATVLLVGSGLLIRSFVRVAGIDAGFRPDHVVKMTMALPPTRYRRDSDRSQFYDRALEQVRIIPGIRSAAFTSKLPLLGGNNGPILIAGRPRPKNLWESPLVEFSRVSPDYFRTLGIRLLRGRDFNAHDGPESAGVAIVSEALVKTFWPHEDPLGKRVSHFDDPPKWKLVVGVVADVRQWVSRGKPSPRCIHRSCRSPWATHPFWRAPMATL
jgi:putative ABC transport system permease protein